MQENEFEKKVFSEMQGLQFKPSEEVWVKVEERIRKKKRRRVFIILFFAAGIALLGYWQQDYFFGPKKSELVNNETIQTNKKEISNTENSTPSLKKETKPDKTSITTVAKTNNTEKKDKHINEPVVNPAVESTQGKNKNAFSSINKASEKDQKGSYQPAPKMDVAETQVTGDSILKKEEFTTSRQIEQTDTALVKTNEGKKEEEKSQEIKAVDEIKKDSSAVTKVQKSFSKKWKWGIQFTPGISSLDENFISLDMTKSADAFAYSNPSGSTGGSASSQVIVPPSESKSGFAFQAGVFAQKQFTPRSSLLLGLQYGYYSDHIHIGSVLNSSSLTAMLDARNVYAAGGASDDHTNQYHFIELPMLYQLQLNKKELHPFTLNAGFTLSQLISTNALVYDTAFGGIYYHDKNNFHKTQFSISTGLSWTIMNQPNMQWTIGPVIDLHVNSFLDNPLDSKKYLDFAGLRSAFIFSRKK